MAIMEYESLLFEDNLPNRLKKKNFINILNNLKMGIIRQEK